MDILFGLLVVVAIAIVLAALMWRPPRGRRTSVDEALQDAALRREQDERLTDAVEQGDKLGIRSPRRVI